MVLTDGVASSDDWCLASSQNNDNAPQAGSHTLIFKLNRVEGYRLKMGPHVVTGCRELAIWGL